MQTRAAESAKASGTNAKRMPSAERSACARSVVCSDPGSPNANPCALVGPWIVCAFVAGCYACAMSANRIAEQVRRALIAAAKTMPIVAAIDTAGCSVHGPQQEVACAGNLVVWCPACWPNAIDGGLDAGKSRDASKER